MFSGILLDLGIRYLNLYLGIIILLKLCSENKCKFKECELGFDQTLFQNIVFYFTRNSALLASF